MRGMLIAILLLAGCQSVGVDQAIGAQYAAIETAAQGLKRLCGNTEPDGGCYPGSPIATIEKQAFKAQLQKAKDLTDLAMAAYVAGEAHEGGLEQAAAILDFIEQQLREAEARRNECVYSGVLGYWVRPGTTEECR